MREIVIVTLVIIAGLTVFTEAPFDVAAKHKRDTEAVKALYRQIAIATGKDNIPPVPVRVMADVD